jgi:hypothetical protein
MKSIIPANIQRVNKPGIPTCRQDIVLSITFRSEGLTH